jgi:hypothetical protein
MSTCKRMRLDPSQGGEMTQALYAHMNNKTIKKIQNGSKTYHKR